LLCICFLQFRISRAIIRRRPYRSRTISVAGAGRSSLHRHNNGLAIGRYAFPATMTKLMGWKRPHLGRGELTAARLSESLEPPYGQRKQHHSEFRVCCLHFLAPLVLVEIMKVYEQ
jgi:hypothetical protein